MGRRRRNPGWYTPLNESMTKRLRFPIDEVKWIRGGAMRQSAGRETGVVEIRGKRYAVYGVKCGGGCECDARIVPIDRRSNPSLAKFNDLWRRR